jgi:hypothetical protein
MTSVKEPLTGPSSASFLKSLTSQPKPRHSEAPANKSSDKLNANHCHFTFADGRQCKMPPAHLCAHHARKRRKPGAEGAPDTALGVLKAPELAALCADLTTATNINRALAQVFLLTAQGRISQKQAIAFGYLSQLLLQTVPGIRSEFVSAFGYQPWEQRLKSSLESNHNENPNDPDPGGETPRQPIDTPIVDRRPFEERVMEPDYDSIVSRGRDLLAGKYDATPEGRREAKTLDTELELMKPPAAKMPKGARASVIEHMKRWIAQKKVPAAKRADPANMPPVLNMLGHPIPMSVHYDKIEGGADLASRTPSCGESHGHQELSPLNKVPSPPKPETPRLTPPFSSPPSERAPVTPRANLPEDHFVQPPSAEPCSSGPGASAPALRVSGQSPQPPETGPESRQSTRADWYAPASWSNTRKPDPFPSRREKSARRLRGMSNCRLRHLQHSQQSQASPLK